MSSFIPSPPPETIIMPNTSSSFFGPRAFLAARNIKVSFRRYGIEALNFMALGLFSSLIIGLILKNIGAWAGLPWLVDVGTQAQQMTGAAIGAGVAMELGCAAVLMNTAIAKAQDPVMMARAMKAGVEAGRLARLAGRMPRKYYAATPSSPTEGLLPSVAR